LLFALPFLAIAHYFLQGRFFPGGVEPFRWGWLAISAVLGLVLGDAFLFRAFVLVGPRLGMLLLSTAPIYSTLFGWLLFRERITPLELGGIALAVWGVAWVVTERQAEQAAVETNDYRRGIGFGLAAALGQVANLVTARYGLVGNFPTLSATIIRILVAAGVVWAFVLLRGQGRHTLEQWHDRRAVLMMLGGSIVGPFLGIWLSLIAIQNAPLGIASTLMALPPVLLIPLEYLLYRRRVSARGIVGTLVAMAGVALILLR
jgi:drug/metabolite transporter (DMT)-like permease